MFEPRMGPDDYCQTIYQCQNPACFSLGEIDPIEGHRLTVRVNDYRALNRDGDCPHWEEKPIPPPPRLITWRRQIWGKT